MLIIEFQNQVGNIITAEDYEVDEEGALTLNDIPSLPVVRVVAHGEELVALRRQFVGIPFSRGKSVTWTGSWAKFIVNNLMYYDHDESYEVAEI